MPKVHYVKAARKDNPAVKKGQPYYHWSFFRGPTMYSATPPRKSQITGSEKLSRAYALQERVEDLGGHLTRTDLEGVQAQCDTVRSELEGIAQEIRDLAQEYTDSADAIRENFSESPTADDCEEKATELEGWADTIDTCVSELESIEFELDDNSDESEEDQAAGFQTKIQDQIDQAVDCPV